MDLRDHLPNARVARWARHQVAGSRCSETPQVAYGFEAFQEALPRCRAFQATAVPQAVARGHVAALDGLGRLAAGAVEPRPDVVSARHVVATALM